MEGFYTEHHKVSIITVCLNSERFLEGAIKSVLEQTYPNIEYIIIDGGSTDNSVKLFDKYKTRINKLIIEKDNGIFNAMNKGLKSATGEIVYFLNSDDKFYDSGVVDIAVRFLINNKGADFIYGNIVVFNPSTGISYIQEYPEKISKWLFLKRTIPQQATFYYSSCFQKAGYFNERYKITSDYEWYLRAIFTKGLRGVRVKNTISIFTIGGISTDYENMDLCLHEKGSIQKKYFGMPEILFAKFFSWLKRLLGGKAVKFLHNIRLKYFISKFRTDIKRGVKPMHIPLRKRTRIYTGNVIHRNKLLRQSLKNGFRVLHYHSITSGLVKDEWEENTTPRDFFYEHMKYLFDNKYNVISCREAVKYLISKQRMPDKTVAITFDDGYRDNYINAVPVLEKYNFPATIFIAVDFLRDYSNNENFLSCSDLKNMRKIGIIDFGSHGLTHRLLSLLDIKELDKEIKLSKQKIEDIIGNDINLFAYPFGHRGSYNKLIIEILKNAGFKGAFTTFFGFNDFKINPFIIKRNRISWLDNIDEFEKHLKGSYDWYWFYQRCFKNSSK